MAKTIMVVDPSATTRRTVHLTLTGAGYDVLEAQDGMEALTKCITRKVDLVFTDLDMPKLNGLQLTRRLRALNSYRQTPIILLTTESQREKKMEGRAAGATGWIVKPFQVEQVVALVKRVCP